MRGKGNGMRQSVCKAVLVAATTAFALMASACGRGGTGGDEEIPFASTSPVVLNTVLQSNMVLQRNSEVSFRGTDGVPGQPVRVVCSWAAEPVVARVTADGTWESRVRTPDAGGPYTVTVEGRNRVVLDNILIGEVWFCAGQSNMQMMMTEIADAEAEIAAAANPNIRLFNIDRRVESDMPVDRTDGEWTECTVQSVRRFSAAAYFFGRTLQAELGVPVGLINASWGNTPGEVWTRRDLIFADAELKADAERLEVNGSAQPFRAGSVYNAMVYPFRKFPVAGAVWYQGENNQSSAWRYGKLLHTLIGGWRADWGRDLAFVVSQICPRYRLWDYRTYYSNAVIRDQQRRAAEALSGCYMTVNDDIADLTDSHPKNKKDVGLRLAWAALAGHYKLSAFEERLCPVLDRTEVVGSEMKVWFRYASGGLTTSDGRNPSGFELAGADGVFHPADARIDDSTVTVTSSFVTAPKQVRLGWSYYKIHNLRSRYGLPASVFTTQDQHDIQEESGSEGPAIN